MKIILLQDINTLGKKNDIKEVAEGYARNFLFPKKMAMAATENMIKSLQSALEKERAVESANIKEQKKQAEIIAAKKLVIKAKEKKGKLFGSITAKNIADEFKKQGLEISSKQVIIGQAIKKTGEYQVEIILSEAVKAKTKLEVQGL